MTILVFLISFTAVFIFLLQFLDKENPYLMIYENKEYQEVSISNI